jgi:tetratricopeptide (TPR) repeat protein
MTAAAFVGRLREIGEVERLLDIAQSGSGAVLEVVGPPGAGKTALLDVAAAAAEARGIEVVRGSLNPVGRDVAALVTAAGPRLVLLDGVDQGEGEVRETLSALAAVGAVAPIVVIATSSAPLGIGEEIRLRPLGEEELAAALGVADEETRHALWVASGGWPGPARELTAALDDPEDPMVQLALNAPSRAWFLRIDAHLLRLIETAIGRAPDGGTRARLLARLARGLLGDASAAGRRRCLVAEAVQLARDLGDPQVLAEVLDASLGAVWEPERAEERLDTGAEIIRLAREAGDLARERTGLFWRFVALMELGRVAEAESTLALFEHEADLAGDAEGALMAKARRASLAFVRGRFDDASQMADQLLEEGGRLRLPDARNVAACILVMIMKERGDASSALAHAQGLLRVAQRDPGHFYEATAAHMLVHSGRLTDASLELERVLPRVLSGSGPRWVGAMANLSFVAATTGNVAAASRIYERLLPFRGRLVTFGDAAFLLEPVSHYLGLLATTVGEMDDAVTLLSEAIGMEEEVGALPSLAHSLTAYASALDARGHAADAEEASKSRQRAGSIAERIGMAALLAQMVPPADEWRLTRDGEDWLLCAGTEQARLRDSRGMRYLRALLASPGRDVPALELAGSGESLVATVSGLVLDDAARRAYRNRLVELDEELDRADRAGDPARAERAETERKVILDELRRNTGLGGRPRQTSPEAERARVNVTRALRATLDQIALRAPKAGAHLQASIRTGGTCRYQAAAGGPTRWSVLPYRSFRSDHLIDIDTSSCMRTPRCNSGDASTPAVGDGDDRASGPGEVAPQPDRSRTRTPLSPPRSRFRTPPTRCNWPLNRMYSPILRL